jgi:hypothetical protein
MAKVTLKGYNYTIELEVGSHITDNEIRLAILEHKHDATGLSGSGSATYAAMRIQQRLNKLNKEAVSNSGQQAQGT